MPSIPAEPGGVLKVTCEICGFVGEWDTSPGRFALVAVGSDDTIDLRPEAALPVNVMVCEGCGAIRLLEARSPGRAGALESG